MYFYIHDRRRRVLSCARGARQDPHDQTRRYSRTFLLTQETRANKRQKLSDMHDDIRALFAPLNEVSRIIHASIDFWKMRDRELTTIQWLALNKPWRIIPELINESNIEANKASLMREIQALYQLCPHPEALVGIDQAVLDTAFAFKDPEAVLYIVRNKKGHILKHLAQKPQPPPNVYPDATLLFKEKYMKAGKVFDTEVFLLKDYAFTPEDEWTAVSNLDLPKSILRRLKEAFRKSKS